MVAPELGAPGAAERWQVRVGLVWREVEWRWSSLCFPRHHRRRHPSPPPPGNSPKESRKSHETDSFRIKRFYTFQESSTAIVLDFKLFFSNHIFKISTDSGKFVSIFHFIGHSYSQKSLKLMHASLKWFKSKCFDRNNETILFRELQTKAFNPLNIKYKKRLY